MRLAIVLAGMVLSIGVARASDPLKQAQEEFVQGRYRKAIELAKLNVDKEPERAWRVIGTSYCSLKEKPGARDAYSHVDEQGKELLRYVCARFDIKLAD